MAHYSTTCIEVITHDQSINEIHQIRRTKQPGKDAKTKHHVVSDPPKAIFEPPTYTMKEIYASIPPHCLHSSTPLSLYYIARDILSVLLLASLATLIPLISSPHLRLLSWSLYAFSQGLIFTGLWELAHECGHSALFPTKTPNYAFGLVIHSFLLVPFHAWRITHSTHHKSTNNLDKDIAFVPPTKAVFDVAKASSNHGPIWEYMEDMPIVALTHLFFHQLIAFPLYLTINNLALERMANARWWQRSHFYLGGDGPNFKPEQWRNLLISNLGIASMVAVLYFMVQRFGAWNVMLFYGLPYLWTNHWILTITFLQHTDASIPYYPTATWTFLRGAASTVDRDFGFVGRHLFHGAIEGHVLHHHISRIPFYYAPEATAAMKEVMGVHYRGEFERSYLGAWWGNFRACKFVEERVLSGVKEGKETGVYFFAK